MFKLPHTLRSNTILIQHLYVVLVLFMLLVIVVVRGDQTSRFGLIIPKNKSAIPNPIIFTYASSTIPLLEAKAYVVYDVMAKKVILGKDENKILPLASMTKLATAVTATELTSTTSLVSISPRDLDGGYDIGLHNGQSFRLGELIKYMLVFSSNDAANAIADTLGGRARFVQAMNQFVITHGMMTLHFTNPNGLDSKTEFGGKGSALDVARLMAYAYKSIPNLLDATTKTRARISSSSGALTGVPNTNQEIEHFTGIMGSKTGFTDEAGGNLTVVFDVALGRPVVIVVMGSSREGRFIDVEKLYAFTKNALQ